MCVCDLVFFLGLSVCERNQDNKHYITLRDWYLYKVTNCTCVLDVDMNGFGVPRIIIVLGPRINGLVDTV